MRTFVRLFPRPVLRWVTVHVIAPLLRRYPAWREKVAAEVERREVRR